MTKRVGEPTPQPESVEGFSIGHRGQGCLALKGYTKEARRCPFSCL